MKRSLPILLALLITSLFAADEKFVDCGPSFVMAAGKTRDGIPSVECKRLWCRDLENGKPMGSGATAANGYMLALDETCDPMNPRECVECFGRRKWCPGETAGTFDPDLGVYVKPAGAQYRSVLNGNCYKWQIASHNCATGEVAVMGASGWECLTQGGGGSAAARSAVKIKAVKRTAIQTPSFLKK